jgi:hypothetical protein
VLREIVELIKPTHILFLGWHNTSLKHEFPELIKDVYPYKYGDTGYMKENGYTSTAIHNYQGEFFNRNKVYYNLGFDRFIPFETMSNVRKRPGTIWAGDDVLKEEIDNVSNEVAHQLVKKWWGISDDGAIDNTLLFELACYSATQNQINNASETTLGAQQTLFNDLADATMSNTYVDFTKVDFYENEPIAAFIKNIMMLVASQTPAPANAGVIMAAEKAYEASKEGYTAFTNTLLYKLEWNDSIANEFYSIWTDANHIDMVKFNDMKFNLVYVGNTKASATCMMKKEDKGQNAQYMVEKTVAKALNRQFADMQRKFEEFRPMVPVLGIDAKGGLIADMGTKEGVKVGDKFNLLEPVTNEKGVTKYKYIATVKVVKWSQGEEFENGVWNNEDLNQAEAADAEGVSLDIIGTHLSKFKNATPSMFVKMTK